MILIGSFSNNEQIEQILLEVFESKFNSHYISYTNEINKTISNYVLPNIVYCAYIKSYLYQFISYIFKKAKGLIDLSDITKSLTYGNDNQLKSKKEK